MTIHDLNIRDNFPNIFEYKGELSLADNFLHILLQPILSIIMTITGLMKFRQVPINFHFCGESLPTFLNLAHVWMILPENHLLLLPLRGMVLSLMLVHL